MPTVALATAISAFTLDEDLAPLITAFERAGTTIATVAWDDPTVSWARFDAVLLRSTWNYTQCLPAFIEWCERVSQQTRLLNPVEVVRWNTDKRYFQTLAAAGAPVIDSNFLVPGDPPTGFPAMDEFVIKPTVGAGSRGARRFTADERDAAVAHAQALLGAGFAVMIQPYLHAVDSEGETALMFFDGEFSHAIRKGPLLRRGKDATRALFAAEHITTRIASAQEIAVARQVLAAVPFERPLLYARVDLLPSSEGPRLLELELTEPSLFLAHDDGAADRLVVAVGRHLAQ